VKIRGLSAIGMSMLALTLASCGGAGSSSKTPEKPGIRFDSPALAAGRAIPISYKCDVRDDWLPLRWGSLPKGTKELVLYIVRFGTPNATKGGAVKAEIQAEAIVVGLGPTLHQLSPGKFPAHAIVGIRSVKQGESICPSAGTAQNLLFRLYALPHKLDLSKGSQPSTLVNTLSAQALAAGTFIAQYGGSPKATHRPS
jgi:phosphatidylethanolamine-binding protein (PEBP) family uncharacterized protein